MATSISGCDVCTACRVVCDAHVMCLIKGCICWWKESWAYNSVQNVLSFRPETAYLRELFETYRSRRYTNGITQLRNLECYMTKKAIIYTISIVTELTEWQFNELNMLLGCVDKKDVNEKLRTDLWSLLYTFLVTHVQFSSPACLSYDTSIAASKVSTTYNAI
jgi:hypothetical protein